MSEDKTAVNGSPVDGTHLYCKISPQEYSIQMIDHILDNLYGQIGITIVEKQLELLPIFKRLHNISQLGVVNWIFPCAVHTRYVHSLGVMQMAYNMAMHINMNAMRYGHQSKPFFNDSELQIIRFAGMLHDIGHYPLSHNIEAAYAEGSEEIQGKRKSVVTQQKDLVGCPDYLAAKDKGIGYLYNPRSKDFIEQERAKYRKSIAGSKGYHHEAIGAQIIENNADIHKKVKEYFVTWMVGEERQLNPVCAPVNSDPNLEYDADVITDRLLEMIASIVIGNYDYDSKAAEYKFEEKYSAMVQLIHSELDADNLDYLLRDATFSGTSYGVMDVGILLNCLTVKEIKIEGLVGGKNEETRYLVGVLPKGIGCVEQFFSNKYLAYSQMIFSKYVSALESMLLNWAKHSLPHNEIYGLEKEDEPDKNSAQEKDGQSKKSNNELFLGMVKSKRTETSYLHFTDAFVLQDIYSNYTASKAEEKKRLGRPDLVRRAILSRLVNYTSFELKDELECLCVGFGEDDIRQQMKDDSLYQEYSALLHKIGEKTVEQLHESACEKDDEKNYEKQLLSFRFENYSMTKQIPFDVFSKRIAPAGCDDIVRWHYYRLATGIPILPKDKQSNFVIKAGTDNGVDKDGIPDLVVDSKASSLHTTWKQKFVYLRKYRIEEISEEQK